MIGVSTGKWGSRVRTCTKRVGWTTRKTIGTVLIHMIRIVISCGKFNKEYKLSAEKQTVTSSFTSNYRAQNSPSSFTYHYSWWIRQCSSYQYARHLSRMNSIKMTLLSMSSGSSVGHRSIPVGDSDFSLSHARVMLNISSFTNSNLVDN